MIAERVAERSFMWKRDVVEAAGATAGGAAAGAKFGGIGGGGSNCQPWSRLFFAFALGDALSL